MSSPSDSVGEALRFTGCPSVRSSQQISLPRYLMNGLSNLHQTCITYSLAPTDDLIRFWVLKVKVTVGRVGVKGVDVDAS